METRKLKTMPHDKMFESEDGQELCHATGREVHFDGNPEYDWWNEYETSDGQLRYGR